MTDEDRSRRPIACFKYLAEWLRMIADHRDITMSEALEKFGGPGIKREYRRCVEEMHAAVVGGEG
jgi:hypothetical protein